MKICIMRSFVSVKYDVEPLMYSHNIDFGFSYHYFTQSKLLLIN